MTAAQQDHIEHTHGLFWDALRELGPEEGSALLFNLVRQDPVWTAEALTEALWAQTNDHTPPHTWALIDALRDFLRAEAPESASLPDDHQPHHTDGGEQ